MFMMYLMISLKTRILCLTKLYFADHVLLKHHNILKYSLFCLYSNCFHPVFPFMTSLYMDD